MRRYLTFSYISIFTNLVWTDNEMKSVKTIYNQINLKKWQRVDSKEIKMLSNGSEKILYVQVKRKNAKKLKI